MRCGDQTGYINGPTSVLQRNPYPAYRIIRTKAFRCSLCEACYNSIRSYGPCSRNDDMRRRFYNSIRKRKIPCCLLYLLDTEDIGLLLSQTRSSVFLPIENICSWIPKKLSHQLSSTTMIDDEMQRRD
ncbi:hypothetical protein TNCV_4690601 [Trichonephila clavipes]|nr:hypothetical protein TNCV_4690601 [Trichonephila clavipes]